jgi:hypothetical protein
MKNSQDKIKLYVPRWLSTVFTIFAILLVPWTLYLAKTLPIRHVEKHWDVAWVGLDIAIILLLMFTGFLASIRSRLVIISLIATSSFLIVDAWFDVISSRPGRELLQAILLAILVEIPLAIAGIVIAYKTINKNVV